MNDESTKAVVRDGAIVIRVPLENLQSVLDGGYACNVYDKRYRVLDAVGAAKEICAALNDEDEEGTPVHRLFDAAINEALDQGAQFLDEQHRKSGDRLNAFASLCKPPPKFIFPAPLTRFLQDAILPSGRTNRHASST